MVFGRLESTFHVYRVRWLRGARRLLHTICHRAKRSTELVHFDTACHYPASPGGSRYVVMFEDSTSRLQRSYSTRVKNGEAILAVVKHFVAEMGVPRASRSDNGAEYTNRTFVAYCNNLAIRRKLTAPCKLQQNGPVESLISRAFKVGRAARLGVTKIYQVIRLEKTKGSTDASVASL